jgi:hypothetical protein
MPHRLAKRASEETEAAMASDANWVEDVRRWFAASQTRRAANAADDGDIEWGYEAANPAVQAAYWPDIPVVPPVTPALQIAAAQELPR